MGDHNQRSPIFRLLTHTMLVNTHYKTSTTLMIRNNTVFETILKHKDDCNAIETAYYHPTDFCYGDNAVFTIQCTNCNNCTETLHTVKPETSVKSNDQTEIHNDFILNRIQRHVEDNHNIELVYYTTSDDVIGNISLECRDCEVVLHDIERENN